MTEKQFKIEFDGHRYFHVIDIVNERGLARLDTMLDAHAWLEVYEMLSDENEQLKSTNMEYEDALGRLEENKQEKRFLKIHDDYYIQYGDDKELFDLHKPADIRSLCIILNREHGFTELQCEYNDKELKYD